MIHGRSIASQHLSSVVTCSNASHYSSDARRCCFGLTLFLPISSINLIRCRCIKFQFGNVFHSLISRKPFRSDRRSAERQRHLIWKVAAEKTVPFSLLPRISSFFSPSMMSPGTLHFSYHTANTIRETTPPSPFYHYSAQIHCPFLLKLIFPASYDLASRYRAQ